MMISELISEIKLENDDFNFSSGYSMLNYCSFFSIEIIKALNQKGICSENLLLKIDGTKLPKDSIVSHSGYCFHNVVLVDGFIIDLTRKQFGSLVNSDITKESKYFEKEWILVKSTRSDKLNL